MHAVGNRHRCGIRLPHVGVDHRDLCQHLAVPGRLHLKLTAVAIAAGPDGDFADVLNIEIFKSDGRAVGDVGYKARILIAILAVLRHLGHPCHAHKRIAAGRAFHKQVAGQIRRIFNSLAHQRAAVHAAGGTCSLGEIAD